MKQIGQRLKKLRKGINLTQVQMAEILGIKQSNITKYEHGNAVPAIETLRKYADYFDVSMDYIFARTDILCENWCEDNQNHSANSIEIQRFVEMCFDPKSPFNARLKSILMQLMEESKIS